MREAGVTLCTVPVSQPQIVEPKPTTSAIRPTRATCELLYCRSLKPRPRHFEDLLEGPEVRFVETRPPSCGTWRNCSEVHVPIAERWLQCPSYQCVPGKKTWRMRAHVPKKCELKRRFREGQLLFQKKEMKDWNDEVICDPNQWNHKMLSGALGKRLRAETSVHLGKLKA